VISVLRLVGPSLQLSISLTGRAVGLTMMALRQYQQATSLAFDQKKLLSALKSSVKAEKVLKKLFKGLLKLPADKKFSGHPRLPIVSSQFLLDDRAR
jgi:hypothetical protein